jgi:predicted Zn-dependent peptidase
MKYDQVTIISSGFNSSKSDLFVKKVKETIKDLTTGNFSDNKLKCSKLDIVVSLEDNEKSPYVIIRNMLSINHFIKENIKERIKLYKNVTKEDVINLAKKMKLMKIVLLRDKDERV